MKKISVIVPTYNSEKTIEDTILSLIRQTYRNFEVIIIDGKSSDRTLEIISDYTDYLPDVTVVSELDEGIYDAFNKGVEKSTGDVIHILNSDDFYSRKYVLEDIITVFNNQKCDVVFSSINMVSEDNEKKVVRHWKVANKITNIDIPPFPGMFVRKKVYDTVGVFDRSFKIAADLDFIIRVLKDTEIGFRKSDSVTVNMRLGGTSTSLRSVVYRNLIENYKAYRKNNFRFPLIWAILKQSRKIKQFFVKG